MYALLAIILIIVVFCWICDWILGAIQSPSQKRGGNPNAPGSYEAPRNWGPPPPPPLPPASRWEPTGSPPPPQVIYLTDSDPTPPLGIPKE